MNRINLNEGWTVQTSRKVQATGEAISTVQFQTKGWYKTSIPMTVVGVRVTAGEFPDLYHGMNLRKILGITAYNIGEQFAHKPIPDDSPYTVSWWYRTEFPTPADHRRVALHFDGINNRANVWMNGKKIADAKDVAGAYRKFELDITPELAEAGTNVVAVEVFAQTQSDLGINWVDWNPTPPDKNMGLWQDVYLTLTGPVQIRYPAAVTELVDSDGATVKLAILLELRNVSDTTVNGKLRAEIPGLRLRVELAESLASRETKSIQLLPEDFAQLTVKNAKLWWPAQMGSPYLYDLHTSFAIADAISDSHHTRFGIRKITSELTTENRARLFRVNGKPILIRGGGWAPDMLLRRNSDKLRAELQYVRDMNLNTIRLKARSKVTNSSISQMKQEYWLWRVGAVAIFGNSGIDGTVIS
jgi:exo-1,4-beta-D-glucosaminidase